MKQTTGVKQKGWIWLVVGLCVVLAVVAGAFLLPMLQTGPQDAPQTVEQNIYWNIDREMYIDPESGLTNREAAEDGFVYFRLAVDGQPVELKANNDRRLIKR